MQSNKFSKPSAKFHEAIDQIIEMGYSEKDYIHHNPAFAGAANIARFLCFYETYKMTEGLNGHIGEVGSFKGASLLYFAKLCEIFEPHSYTRVHGFDWFQGMEPSAQDPGVTTGSYLSDYDRLVKLIELQSLDHLVHVHKMDVTQDLAPFLEQNPGLEFKIVFLDAGTYDVVSACAPLYWERLNSGGILLLDHFGDPRVAGEVVAIREALPDVPVHTFPWSRQPAGYLVKP
jgi:hypothetical protein